MTAAVQGGDSGEKMLANAMFTWFDSKSGGNFYSFVKT